MANNHPNFHLNWTNWVANFAFSKCHHQLAKGNGIFRWWPKSKWERPKNHFAFNLPHNIFKLFWPIPTIIAQNLAKFPLAIWSNWRKGIWPRKCQVMELFGGQRCRRRNYYLKFNVKINLKATDRDFGENGELFTNWWERNMEFLKWIKFMESKN